MAAVRSAMRTNLRQLAAGSRTRISTVQHARLCVGKQCTRFSSTVGTAARRGYHASSAADDTNDNGFSSKEVFQPLDTFARRHIGPSPNSTEEMLKALDPPVKNLDDFVKSVIPPTILTSGELSIDGPWKEDSDVWDKSRGFSETQLTARLQTIAKKNKIYNSYIGCGYAGTITPEVIKRNVLESPAWYTSYTPYQPEISQGRLESLLNFQTMVSDLTALPISNASLLDEPTAAAEALTLSYNMLPASRSKNDDTVYLVSHLVHPQTVAVLQSRADGFKIKIETIDVMKKGAARVKELGQKLVGVLVQYPDTEGGVEDFKGLAEAVHAQGSTFACATDLLALTLLTPPGEFGADIAFGNAQRFGVPFGYGGPHAAFFAVSDKYKRKIPGRLIGVSKDRLGDKALRLALQTREQHIRREKATSNVCTAQALLANMSAFYAVYHGPKGLKAIAEKVVALTRILEEGIRNLGYETGKRGKDAEGRAVFDTISVGVGAGQAEKFIKRAAENYKINYRMLDADRVGVTLDETITEQDMKNILLSFLRASQIKQKGAVEKSNARLLEAAEKMEKVGLSTHLARTSKYLQHPVFNSHHSETELLRYIHHLQSKDLSLTHSMIPLGSCTMKLNSTTEMLPVTWPEFSNIHPFVPLDQAEGYKVLIDELEADLATITGFAAVSLQPNSGAQGEFAGLRVIRAYQEAQQENTGKERNICLIPKSAHGTNPASATMAGMKVVIIKCDEKSGNLDMKHLEEMCIKHKDSLGAFMVTYPSTYGVFEPEVKAACDLVHQYGGQVYMDGANMNAQIGLCSPGEIGADVCHLNLHKTFCIPHGGGGPGVGPIGVASHLAPFLPGHPLVKTGGEHAISPISGAPWGSASILPISWSYIKMMGAKGLTHATKITLLNANYIMSRLRPHYEILYTNTEGRCAHEFILDPRPFSKTAGIEAIDIAKRLQDYGFHAPTMSWPVNGTLMIEPTESESKQELDRFIDALISIRQEIAQIEKGVWDKENNVLKNSPHTQKDLLVGQWNRGYTREQAAYPVDYLREKKFWPSVTRLDDSYGDMNLFCTCSPVDSIE